jgi:hypothetical protein
MHPRGPFLCSRPLARCCGGFKGASHPHRWFLHPQYCRCCTINSACPCSSHTVPPSLAGCSLWYCNTWIFQQRVQTAFSLNPHYVTHMAVPMSHAAQHEPAYAGCIGCCVASRLSETIRVPIIISMQCVPNLCNSNRMVFLCVPRPNRCESIHGAADYALLHILPLLLLLLLPLPPLMLRHECWCCRRYSSSSSRSSSAATAATFTAANSSSAPNLSSCA